MAVTDNIVVSSRVRLARNFKGIPFPQKLNDVNACNIIINKAEKAAENTFEYDLLRMSDVNHIERLSLVERHLISLDLINRPKTGALILSKDESISVMVNEEDHIRAQCIKKGLQLRECYNIINEYDNALAYEMPIAYNSDLGFLTACLTNIGTGMRASAMLFLPAMTLTDSISKYINYAASKNMAVRGVYGERSKPEGCMYQVSNAVTIGLTEHNILDNVEQIVFELCAAEQGLRKQIYSEKKIKFEDEVFRAFGILFNARCLPSSEFMELIAILKFGIAMNVIEFKNLELLDDMIIQAQPANLCMQAGGIELSAAQRDIVRAEFVRKTINKLK